MPHYRRICFAVLLAVLPAFLAWAVDPIPTATLNTQKMSAVSQTLGGTLSGPEAAGVLPRIAGAMAWTEIQTSAAAGELSLVLQADGRVEYQTQKLNDGHRIVIDLFNTICVVSSAAPKSYPAPIAGVQSALISVQPEFVSRLIVDLSESCPYYVQREENSIRLTLDQGMPNTNHGKTALASSIASRSSAPLLELEQQLSDIRSAAAVPEVRPVFESVVDELNVARVASDLQAVAAPPYQISKTKPSLFAAVDTPPAPQGSAPNPAAPAAGSDSSTPQAPAADAKADATPESGDVAMPPAEEPAKEDVQNPSEDSSAPSKETPAPPEKREVAPPVDTTASNAAIADTMRSLIKGLSSGLDLAAEQGLKSSVTEDKKPVSSETPSAASAPKAPVGNPLAQLVDFECDEMPLTKVVPLLAYKAGINVVAGADLTGNVTMSLKGVPLQRAIETALRMNGLGMLEEEGIYRIVPYEEAVSSDRATMMVNFENAKAMEVRKVLEEILKGSRDQDYISLSSNQSANVLVIAGPEERIQPLVAMARQLDVAEPVLPTVTVPIKLNYAEPESLVLMLEKMLTPKIGQVAADPRARHLIITDVPVVVEQITALVKSLDVPVKQVLLDAMVIDATLNDEADTGIDWLLNSVRRQTYRDFIEQGTDGPKIGSLQELGLASAAPAGSTIGKLTFGLLTKDIDWKGVLQAEVRNRNGHLISNPVVVTVENKPATITISQEVPYIELSQTSAGGSQTNTQFKQIGTVLEVTPRVTHDNHVIVDINGKESATNGEFNGIPIEDQRKVQSTLRMMNGQTIFVGGLRKRTDNATVRKIPVLGDVPVMNMLFRNNAHKEQVNELMIFLTCRVVEEELPALEGGQQEAYDEAKGAEGPPQVEQTLWRNTVHPKMSDDAAWKYRRAK